MFTLIHKIGKRRRRAAFRRGVIVGVVCTCGLFTLNNYLKKKKEKKSEEEVKQIEE